ncbi:hypothetical protein [Sneathiella glossodoripedis]|uniref:hypothetical protein n=1 Tax=Sneathiella glossodoripedis TaxID=418853 RepID=UPI0018FF981B|nr:hypothetical protein [Sneathiella glossodoripedis]
MQLEDVIEGELVVPGKLAKLLRTDLKEIAWTIGLDESVLKRQSSRHAPNSQRRLRDLVDALLILTPRFGSPLMAMLGTDQNRLLALRGGQRCN